MGLLQAGAALLAAVLGLGALLVVGNTIRLEIERHREAIRILCLIGATARYARRPFLYSGAWYGLLGGSLAWVLVAVMIGLLDGQVDRLAALYHTRFELRGLAPGEVALLLAASTLIGVLGSWAATGRHLGIGDEG
jgi:cell division transport system permease protein